jgi:exodeoxyribonuclease V gamma subunit
MIGNPKANPLTPGFMVIHSNQPELLRQLVVSWVKAHPLSPLEDEVILVQSNGIGQWLKQALAADPSASLSGGCGIAAALQVTLPSRFVWQAYRATIGKQAVPEASPFDKPRLIWRLMRLLPSLAQDADYAPLARFLAQDSEQRKRYQLAERLADLFDQYQVYRADWLEAWAEGHEGLLDAQGRLTPLPPELIWQPRLWQALQADVGEASCTSRAAVHQRFLDAAATRKERPADLPPRVMVFGLSSLPKQSLEVLLAISRWTQVVLCVNNPCEHYWANILTEKDFLKHNQGRHSRKPSMPETVSEEDLHLHAHPLLAAWGKQGRDYIHLLDQMDTPAQYQQLLVDIGQRIDVFEPHGEGCLLNQLQDDIRTLRPLAESRAQWAPVNPEQDGSMRFHIAHSPQREVEVLHDQLLAAFDADPTLTPRDVIVMVPDITPYRPHIEAVFGQIHHNDARYLPYSIADIGARHHSPLLYALEFLLGINEAPLTISEVLDLLNVPAVQKRFGFEEPDVMLLHQWIAKANIRWGLDRRHRQSLGVHFDCEQNTWTFGLKRMLLGYAVGNDVTGREDADWHDIEPFADVAGLDAAVVGPLARLLTQIEALLQSFAEPAPAPEWGRRLNQLLVDFFDSRDTDDAYQLLQLRAALEQWVAACEEAALDEPLTLAVVRDYWLSQIDTASLSQRFFAGHLTFATLMPMRAIPFRRIYLLGMNDGDYPRPAIPNDFDLMAKDYRPGDRSRREDDRYLFLEALLSAREHLHISWVGRSIHDNSERTPSVLVSQLRDHLAAGWQLADHAQEKALLDLLTVEHRLQPFSKDYFDGQPDDSPFFTYAREWQTPPSHAAGISEALPEKLDLPLFEAAIPLHRLTTFLKDPVKTFFRDRLGVFYELDEMASEEQEPFALDPLSQWAIQHELIQVRLDAKQQGKSEAEAVQRQLARIRRQGLLPTGSLAQLLQVSLAAPLEPLFERYEAARALWPVPLEDEVIDFEHFIQGQPLKIHGAVSQLFSNSQGQRCRIEISSSNLIEKQKYRREKFFSAWVHHLAGHLNGQPVTTYLIGKNGNAVLSPLDPEWAKQYFLDLIECYAAGLCAPLPFAPKTGFTWLEKQGERFEGPLNACTSTAIGTARKYYEGDFYTAGEIADNPYLQRAYPTFENLWSEGDFTLWTQRLLSPLNESLSAKTQPAPESASRDEDQQTVA